MSDGGRSGGGRGGGSRGGSGSGRGSGAGSGRGDRGGRRDDRRDAPGRAAAGRDARDGDRASRGPERRDRPGSPHSAAVSPARRVAVEVLRRVRVDDAYANLLLPSRIREAGLGPKDAALATELTYGTLRGLGTYDAVIAIAADREVDRIDPAVLDVLRLGAHQLLSMRTAEHAAVNESVEQARVAGGLGAASFANAVLRRIAGEPADVWIDRAVSARSGDDVLAVRWSHPVWIVRALRMSLAADPATKALGVDANADLEHLLQVDQQPPAVALAALPGIAETESDAALPRRPYAPTARAAPPGDPGQLAGVRSGVLRVQDEGSQLAALALTRARPVVAGERWLDLAAGPGGKAALLAAEAALGGATLLANEVSEARTGLVERALGPVPGVHEVRTSDGRMIGDAMPETFDRILLDAPCTGIGALRRRPEARWRKRPTDVPQLAVLQEQLADSAVAALKPGGLLAYVTCSPHLAETRQQVTRLLRRHGDLKSVDTGAVLAGFVRAPLAGVGPGQPVVQLWPHRHGTDAMFIALLQRSP